MDSNGTVSSQRDGSPRRSVRTWTRFAAVLGVATFGFLTVAASCSGSVEFSVGGKSPEDAAKGVIDGELTDQIGLGDMDTSCDSVDDPEVGTEFECQSITDGGQEIRWSVVVDEEDSIDVNSTNLIRADVWARFVEAGAGLLAEQSGRPLGVEDLDCGVGPIILPDDNIVECVLTPPGSGNTLEAFITVTDIATGEFFIEVGE